VVILCMYRARPLFVSHARLLFNAFPLQTLSLRMVCFVLRVMHLEYVVKIVVMLLRTAVDVMVDVTVVVCS